MIEYMSLASVVAGCDGLILEVYDRTMESLCDKEQAIDIEGLKTIIDKIDKLKK